MQVVRFSLAGTGNVIKRYKATFIASNCTFKLHNNHVFVFLRKALYDNFFFFVALLGVEKHGTNLLSVLDLGAVQIELSTWQHRIALQLCVAHCLCSLSSLRCGVEKSLRTTNETVFLANINLSVGSECQNALCSANNATKAETAAVRRLSKSLSCLFICLFVR